MAEDSGTIPWNIGGAIVAGLVGLIIGIAWAASQTPTPPTFRAETGDVQTMLNHETIRWRDRRGLHVVEVDRRVEMPE